MLNLNHKKNSNLDSWIRIGCCSSEVPAPDDVSVGSNLLKVDRRSRHLDLLDRELGGSRHDLKRKHCCLLMFKKFKEKFLAKSSTKGRA